MPKIRRGKKVQCLNCGYQFRSKQITKKGVEPRDIKCGACNKRGVEILLKSHQKEIEGEEADLSSESLTKKAIDGVKRAEESAYDAACTLRNLLNNKGTEEIAQNILYKHNLYSEANHQYWREELENKENEIRNLKAEKKNLRKKFNDLKKANESLKEKNEKLQDKATKEYQQSKAGRDLEKQKQKRILLTQILQAERAEEIKRIQLKATKNLMLAQLAKATAEKIPPKLLTILVMQLALSGEINAQKLVERILQSSKRAQERSERNSIRLQP